MGALALLAYTIGRVFFDADPANPVTGRTMAFCVLSLSSWSTASTCARSILFSGWDLFQQEAGGCLRAVCLPHGQRGAVPPLAALFKTTALTGFQWLLVAVLSLCPLLVVEGEKLLWEHLPRKKKN